MAMDKMQKQILDRLDAIDAKLEQISAALKSEEKKPAPKKTEKS